LGAGREKFARGKLEMAEGFVGFGPAQCARFAPLWKRNAGHQSQIGGLGLRKMLTTRPE
jgi:hypothetical protein